MTSSSTRFAHSPDGWQRWPAWAVRRAEPPGTRGDDSDGCAIRARHASKMNTATPISVGSSSPTCYGPGIGSAATPIPKSRSPAMQTLARQPLIWLHAPTPRVRIPIEPKMLWRRVPRNARYRGLDGAPSVRGVQLGITPGPGTSGYPAQDRRAGAVPRRGTPALPGRLPEGHRAKSLSGWSEGIRSRHEVGGDSVIRCGVAIYGNQCAGCITSGTVQGWESPQMPARADSQGPQLLVQCADNVLFSSTYRRRPRMYLRSWGASSFVDRRRAWRGA